MRPIRNRGVSAEFKCRDADCGSGNGHLWRFVDGRQSKHGGAGAVRQFVCDSDPHHCVSIGRCVGRQSRTVWGWPTRDACLDRARVRYHRRIRHRTCLADLHHAIKDARMKKSLVKSTRLFACNVTLRTNSAVSSLTHTSKSMSPHSTSRESHRNRPS